MHEVDCMGRIKHRIIKKSGRELMEKLEDKFSPDFQKNKELLKELKLTSSAKIRNRIAGYIVRLAKRAQ